MAMAANAGRLGRTKPLSGLGERVVRVIKELFPHGRGGTGDEAYEG